MRVPRVNTVERLADALQVSAGWLAFGIEAPWTRAEEARSAGMAARFSEARSSLGLSVKDLARRAGTSPAEVRIVEQGSMPTLGTVALLARGLGVSPSWLAFGEGPRGARPAAAPAAPAP